MNFSRSDYFSRPWLIFETKSKVHLDLKLILCIWRNLEQVTLAWITLYVHNAPIWCNSKKIYIYFFHLTNEWHDNDSHILIPWPPMPNTTTSRSWPLPKMILFSFLHMYVHSCWVCWKSENRQGASAFKWFITCTTTATTKTYLLLIWVKYVV